MKEFTSCWWENLRYFATDYTAVWGYCKQKSKSDQRIKCTQFYHRGNPLTFNRHISVTGWLDGKSEVTVEIPHYFHRRWTHFCWQYSSVTGKNMFYYNGKLIGTRKIQERPIIGTDDKLPAALIIGQEQDAIKGRYELSQILNGQISEFNIWNRILDSNTISGISSCVNFTKGNVVKWEKDKFRINKAKFIEVPDISAFCSNVPEYVLFPQAQTLKNSKTLCTIHGGRIVVPKTENENNAIMGILESHGSHCLQMQTPRQKNRSIWLGFQRIREKWQIMHDDVPIGEAPYGKWDKFTPVYPNLGCTFLQTDGYWSFRDKTSCNEMELCTMCEFESVPVFSLKGELCKDFTPFDWNYYFTTNSSYQIDKYIGYKTTDILQENGSWNGKAEGAAIHLKGHSNPIGRHRWIWHNRRCGITKPIYRTLSLSVCEFGTDFTCMSGRCIPISKRCDQILDCQDGSDEENCVLVHIPEGYNRMQAPSNNNLNGNEPLQIRTQLIIRKIDMIDTVAMLVGLTVEIKMKWNDSRLKFANLNMKKKNPVSEEIVERLWLPLDNVIYENAVIGKIHMDNIRRVFVNPEADPLPLSGLEVYEEYVYDGGMNILEVAQRFRIEYDCMFQLAKFPFDEQQCDFILKMALERNNSIALVLDEPSIIYNGDIKMDQFHIGPMISNTINNENETRFVLTLQMDRLFNDQMINTFMPTFLLWMLCYSTMFIRIDDFNDRFMGAVTSLLVLAALLSSISQSLPQTSYFKYIDLWFLWYLANIFCMIVYHILLDMDHSKANHSNIQMNTIPQICPIKERHETRTTMTTKNSNYISEELALKKNRTNKKAIIIFPIISLSFNIIYFILTT